MTFFTIDPFDVNESVFFDIFDWLALYELYQKHSPNVHRSLVEPAKSTYSRLLSFKGAHLAASNEVFKNFRS